MKTDELLVQAHRILQQCGNSRTILGTLSEAQELVRTTAGERSAFYLALAGIERRSNEEYLANQVRSTFEGFVRHLENGLLGGASLLRQARADVESDLLEQAQQLLSSTDYHPAAAAVLVGAILEDFVRTWTEEAGLELGTRKPGLEAYTGLLRDAALISKQDAKDITSWGGIRNSAAHGRWAEVEDPARIRVMLEGVNLFLRRYAT